MRRKVFLFQSKAVNDERTRFKEPGAERHVEFAEKVRTWFVCVYGRDNVYD